MWVSAMSEHAWEVTEQLLSWGSSLQDEDREFIIIEKRFILLRYWGFIFFN